jgi:FkbM family methyltransferase
MAVNGKALQFVQIGANDGVYGDPLRKYVTSFPWRGILVEPQQDVFMQLRSNYDAEKERLVFENVAISDHSGQITMYRGKHRAIWENSVVSADPETTGRQLRAAGRELEAFTVPCLTLNELLEKHQIYTFDVLQIDAEGHEFKILSTLDLSRFTPLLIQLEHFHMSRRDVDRTVQYLTNGNYRVHYGGHQIDTLAFHETFPLEDWAVR